VTRTSFKWRYFTNHCDFNIYHFKQEKYDGKIRKWYRVEYYRAVCSTCSIILRYLQSSRCYSKFIIIWLIEFLEVETCMYQPLFLLSFLAKPVNNNSLVVFSRKTCHYLYPYCLFSVVLSIRSMLCFTSNSSFNIRRHYVARGTRLATFDVSMLDVDFLLQHIYLFISENLISN